MVRPLLLSLGWLSVALGVVGLFLPLVPTTPFLILAAYCFSRSSRRAHEWLLAQPRVGPLIRDWEERGVIRRRSKWLATGTIGVALLGPAFLPGIPVVGRVSAIVICLGVLGFIWSRPDE